MRYMNTFKALVEGLIGMLAEAGAANASQQSVVSAFFPRREAQTVGSPEGEALSSVDGATRNKTWVSHFVNERAALSVAREFLRLRGKEPSDDLAADVLGTLDAMLLGERAGADMFSSICAANEGMLSRSLRRHLFDRMTASFECVYGAKGGVADEFRRQLDALIEGLERKERCAGSIGSPDSLSKEKWLVLRYACACGIAGHLAVSHFAARMSATLDELDAPRGGDETPNFVAGSRTGDVACRKTAHLLRIKLVDGARQIVQDHRIDDDVRHVVKIGRLAMLNDISTEDAKGVSREHLILEKSKSGWRIVQGVTANGTLVVSPNGHKRSLSMKGSTCALESGTIICCAPIVTTEGDSLLNYDSGAVFRFELE